MNDDKPKSIWKKSWKGRSAVFVWCALFGVAILLAAFIAALGKANASIGQTLVEATVMAILLVLGVLFFIYAMIPFLRWLLWKHWRRMLFGFACFLTLIALFYAEEDWRGKHDWENFKRQWEAKGEKFAFKDFVPPPVPDDKNFAFSPVWIAGERYNFQNELKRAEAWYGNRIYDADVTKILPFLPVSVSALVGTNWAYHSPPTPEISGNWAVARMTDLKPWQSYYRNLEETDPTAEIPIAPQAQSPAQDVLLALSKFNPVIDQLRTDSTRPYSRFPLGYDDENKAAILLPHLAELKRYAQVLQLRAIAELQNGQSDQALDDVGLMLYLANSIRTEPFLISHLIRIAIVNSALQPIYEGLAKHKWSDTQLADLDLKLAQFNFLVDYKVAMRGELGCRVGTIEFIRHRNLRSFRETFGLSSESGASQLNSAALLYYLSPNGWFYQNELSISRFFEKWYFPLVDEKKETVSPAAADKVNSVCTLELNHQPPEDFLEKWLLPALGTVVGKFGYMQESIDLAQVAIALERFRLARGEYPESLDELAPQFIPKLPHDIINGQPLHYHRTSDGQFVLYSVGWNEADDGGEVVFDKGSLDRVDISKGDWVWRYPAK